ncbi:aldo/keto reductase [Agrobacterium vitis]|uniref:Aldo/keto reductase n=1 Tax=Agrobacterium vitis TaxID=373 RepID=A0AAE4X126_AGRVI|nr:aldo/keto reductase [Agrobacterium vitis]MBF2714127.1 aldo/keto reductase [Agrobacterium vitis]MUO81506.1 aldo/keto reductase [Agrobacterium vitis]MUO95847.1 aldo/keto reductase [Agrobacterium vitis]MVA93926.1 aldo/keto reductase [Agrobacterium vitis]MVB03567.1 aldo/keto reductase [Agrobacterium vitis]
MSLGTANFGASGNPDHTEAQKVIHKSLDVGVNLIDTNDVYSNGEAEEIVGAALKGRRDDVIVSTKFGSPSGPEVNRAGASRRWIIQAVEASLRRLQTDWIDIYHLHRPAPDCDLEETLEALTDLVKQGKIRYFGSSSTSAPDIVEAQWVSQRRNLGRFASEQICYNLLARGVERAELATCQKYRIGVLVWSPLCGGWLSGAYRVGAEPPRPLRSKIPIFASLYDTAIPENQLKLEAADQLATLAEEAGISLPELALAFALNHPAVSSVILGPDGLAHLESALRGIDVVLADDIMNEIDRIVPAGTTINAVDWGFSPLSLSPKALRRRR